MENYTYNFKITGSGTAKEIAEELKQIIDSITEAENSEHEVAILDGAEWESSISMTEINAD